jgi:CBS domain containing-hemolysin-like protein
VIYTWAFLSVFGVAWCALGRMVQLALARARTKKIRALQERFPLGVKRARVIRLYADHYLFAAQFSAFAGAALFGTGFALVMLNIIDDERASVIAKGLPDGVLAYIFSSPPLAIAAEFVLLGVVPIFALQGLRILAFNKPEICLVKISGLFLLLSSILAPALYVLERFTAGISSLTGALIPSERQIVVPENNLSEIVDGPSAEIEEHDRELIRSVVEMSHTLVKEVMTPRADMVTVSRDDSVGDAIRCFIKEKVSRVLVTAEHLDDIRGVIHAKDLLGLPLDSTRPLREFLRPVARIGGELKVDDALRQLLTSANHMAVVADEHGGVDGLVTVEDLLEELVGEIFDEFDSPTEEAPVRQTAAGDLVISGSLSIDEFNARSGATVPEGEYDTIAGYILELLGRIPAVGEVVDCAGAIVKVEVVEQNRLVNLRVIRSRRSMRVITGKPAEVGVKGEAGNTRSTTSPVVSKVESA